MLYLSGSLGYTSIPELMGLILIFILILALAYFVTRWLGKNGYNLQKNRNIEIIETFRLNQNNAIYIVKIANKIAALGVSKERIEYLMELDEDEVEIVENQSSSTAMLFQEILKKHQDKRKE